MTRYYCFCVLLQATNINIKLLIKAILTSILLLLLYELHVKVHNVIGENGYFHTAKLRLFIQFSMRIAKKVCFLCSTEYLLHKIGGFWHFSKDETENNQFI